MQTEAHGRQRPVGDRGPWVTEACGSRRPVGHRGPWVTEARGFGGGG